MNVIQNFASAFTCKTQAKSLVSYPANYNLLPLYVHANAVDSLLNIVVQMRISLLFSATQYVARLASLAKDPQCRLFLSLICNKRPQWLGLMENYGVAQ